LNLSAGAPRDTTAFELREALAQPGCAICALALRSVGRFIASLAYDRVNDIQIRAELRAARGFCNLHAHRWLREAHSVLGTALIYRDVVNTAVQDLATLKDRGRLGLLDRLRGRTSDASRADTCLACAAQHEAEQRYLSGLAAILTDPGDAALFDGSDGVCLPHALAAVRSGDSSAERVMLHARAHAERLIASLDEVIRKEDYRFRDEPRTADERAAPADVVAWTIGADGLSTDL
jgi:hypothetical protein